MPSATVLKRQLWPQPSSAKLRSQISTTGVRCYQIKCSSMATGEVTKAEEQGFTHRTNARTLQGMPQTYSAQGDGVAVAGITPAESLVKSYLSVNWTLALGKGRKEHFSPKLPRVCGSDWELIWFNLWQKLRQICALNPDSWGFSCSIFHVSVRDRSWGELSLQLRSSGEREAKRELNPAKLENRYLGSAFGSCHVLLPSDFSFIPKTGQEKWWPWRTPKSASGKKRVEGSNATVWGRGQQMHLSHLKRTW